MLRIAQRDDGRVRGDAAVVRPVSAVVVGALAASWLLLTLLDLRDNDGAAPLIAMFGIPAIASAVVIQIVISRTPERARFPRAVLWWMLAVLPAGTLAAFLVALARDPEYFIGDEGPWMLIWVPIFIGVGVLLGAVIWFFFVFPLVALWTAVGRIARGEAGASTIIMPLTLLALGVLCVVGGLSIDTDGSGRASWGVIIAAFLGLPGDYDVIWEPGLWIVRGIAVGITLLFAVPAVLERMREDRADRASR